MGLINTDSAFKSPTTGPQSDLAPATILQQSYETCVNEPSVDCLLESARRLTENLPYNLGGDPTRQVELALLIAKPSVARELLVSGGVKPSLRPGPVTAYHTALLADAENQLKNEATATELYERALSEAGRDVPGYTHWIPTALSQVGMVLAQAGKIEMAQRAHDQIAPTRNDVLVPLQKELALAYARSGNSERAMRYSIADTVNRIGTEQILFKARSGDLKGALQDLRQIESDALRALTLAELSSFRSMEKNSDRKALEDIVIKTFRKNDFIGAESMSSRERRHLVHVYLKLIGEFASVIGLQERQRLIEMLRSKLDEIEDLNLRLRANCEIAYAGRSAGMSFEWPSLDAYALDSRFPATPPKAYGACANWMKRAGEVQGAMQLMSKAFEGIRLDANSSRHADARSRKHWLVEHAMEQYEYEIGEVFTNEWGRTGFL